MIQESRSSSRLTNWGKGRIPSPRIQERPGYMVDLMEDPGALGSGLKSRGW